MKSLILAFQFLTLMPLPKVAVEAKHFGQSMMFFPLVGFVLGITIYGIHLVASSFSLPVSAEVQALLILATLTVLTRALHLDGFADMVDGFWGGRNKEDRLRIMKDSHIGVFGVIGLVFLILGKYLFLTKIIAGVDPAPILLLFPVISRWAMVLVCFRARDPRTDGGLAQSFVESLRWPHLVTATLFAVSLGLFLIRERTFWLFALATTVVVALRFLSSRKLGGVTGDVCGATGEVIELFVLQFWYGFL